MKGSDIAAWLRTEVEPLPDQIYGSRYRAAAFLKDGTFLPCVVFQSKRKQLALALRRFEELRKEKDQYRMVVETFAATGARVNDYDLDRVEKSPYAWPLRILKTIQGETTMGWTSFVIEMNDGAKFNYGTSFHFEFFELPPGYSYDQISEIHSGVVYSESNGIRPFSMEGMKSVKCLRERPFFICYLNEIDA